MVSMVKVSAFQVRRSGVGVCHGLHRSQGKRTLFDLRRDVPERRSARCREVRLQEPTVLGRGDPEVRGGHGHGACLISI